MTKMQEMQGRNGPCRIEAQRKISIDQLDEHFPGLTHKYAEMESSPKAIIEGIACTIETMFKRRQNCRGNPPTEPYILQLGILKPLNAELMNESMSIKLKALVSCTRNKCWTSLEDR